VIIASPWWNPKAEQQAIDRTHRIGQVNPVFAYRLVCENTIEVEIIARQARKNALSASVIDRDGVLAEPEFTLDDIVALFGADPTGQSVEAIEGDFNVVAPATPTSAPAAPDAVPETAQASLPFVRVAENAPAAPAPERDRPRPVAAPGIPQAISKPATVRPSAQERASIRTAVGQWVREQVNAQPKSIATLTAEMGQTGQWLTNRMYAIARFSLQDLNRLAALLDVPLPWEYQVAVAKDWGLPEPERRAPDADAIVANARR
jgi:hypothetical protein